MYLLMFEQMGLLAKRLGTHFTAKGFLPGMRPQVDLDVTLVEEATITDATAMHRFLFAQQAGQIVGIEVYGGGRGNGI